MRVIEQRELGFSVEVHQPPEGIRAMVDGDLDLITAPHLEAVLERVGVENGQPTVFLDLTGVGFLDAAGWRVLERAARALENRGGRLIVAEVSHPVKRFMQLIGDHRVDLGSDGAEAPAPDLPVGGNFL